ncbi:hypothetical protein [Tunicatimonas pelagia]|uniref:hypothetical protein n=1 Tax=Tunicatimonas pelagia TaxID=931531 RepID=UPI0026670566|nr:hypothetical protein [Tunicatimonas pelagia]WKN45217.1 hypothetical protein P0M28_09625 [Tunicatimonas pelagia]
MRFLSPIVFLLLLSSCNYSEQISQELNQEPYFDLTGLVAQQLVHLDSLYPSVEITATINDRKEVETMRKDSANWAETLKLFSEANINLPVLQGSYQVTDSTDQEHGWNIRTYQALKTANVEIPYLAVYYQKTLQDVRKVEAIFREKNMLYRTERHMEMQLTPAEVGPLLTEYQSSGTQKMLFRDSVHYQLRATLKYPSLN